MPILGGCTSTSCMNILHNQAMICIIKVSYWGAFPNSARLFCIYIIVALHIFPNFDFFSRPYVTAAWRGDSCETTEQAAKYCRAVYDAGFSPICPTLYLPLFLNDAVPEEHKSGIDMGRDLLRRSRVLVVCGGPVTEEMKNDIATAQRLGITATTLEGILTVKGQGHRRR